MDNLLFIKLINYFKLKLLIKKVLIQESTAIINIPVINHKPYTVVLRQKTVILFGQVS